MVSLMGLLALARSARRPVRRCAVCVTAIAGLSASLATAQELEPRAYAPSPVGVTFVGVGFSRSTGALLFDPSLAITDASGKINSTALTVGRIIAVKGRPVLVAAGLPYVWGTAAGRVSGKTGTVDRSGLGDLRFKVSVNLSGTPALSARDFGKAARRPVIGASLGMVAPTGQYSPATFINIGAHRWAFKPEVGVSFPRGRWDFDGYLSSWLFTRNDDYYPGGLRRTQKPIVAMQAHAACTIRPRVWIAGDATWYTGGATSLEGGAPHNRIDGGRLGITLALPVGASHSLKLAYSTGLWTRSGTDFDTFAVAWQTAWIDRR